MTGSLAVVMAALLPMLKEGAEERSQFMRVLRHSRFGVVETLERIEAQARDQGLCVIARVDGERRVIVLSSSVGGTPVFMAEAHSAPAVPLSVAVQAGSDGGADVLVRSDSQRTPESWLGLPSAVVDDFAALPRIVERALT